MTISTGNKLIAQYIGAEETSCFTITRGRINRWMKVTIPGVGVIRYFEHKVSNYPDYRVLEFHSSWDWLLPVVAKCHNESEIVSYELLSSLIYLDKEKAWKKVINYIQLKNGKK